MDEIEKTIEREDETEKEVETQQQIINRLSNKAKLTAKERDDLAKAKGELEQTNANLKKENEFLSNFSDMTSKYKDATTYKDKIKEKVMAGYSVEDATVAVLAKEGKLNTPPVEIEKPDIAGGSADTTHVGKGATKTVAEMSQEERRAELVKRENEDGSLTRILERRSLA